MTIFQLIFVLDNKVLKLCLWNESIFLLNDRLTLLSFVYLLYQMNQFTLQSRVKNIIYALTENIPEKRQLCVSMSLCALILYKLYR